MRYKLSGLRRCGRLVIALAVGAAVFGIATAVQASIPDTNGVIHGCYKTLGGTLRVIQSPGGSCASGEAALNWSQTGPKGSTGSKGVTGQKGATGGKGATGAAGTNGTNGTGGAKGTTGTRGPTGLNGVNGSNGANGANGANGQNGQNGLRGATGPTGPKGPSGSPGTKGSTGVKGPSGARGPTGATTTPSGLLKISTAHYVESDATVDAGAVGGTTATCPSGENAIGGYYTMSISGGLNDGAAPGATTVREAGMLNFNDYEVQIINNQGFGDKVKVKVFAICAGSTP